MLIAPPPTSVPLTAEEDRYLAVWSRMDDGPRRAALATVEAWAKHFPRRAAPSLRVVAGGVK